MKQYNLQFYSKPIIYNLVVAKIILKTIYIYIKTISWFQIGKVVHQGCILSPSLFNLYAEDIMRNAGLDEAPSGIKIAGRNINKLRYADDTTFMAKCRRTKEPLDEGERGE